jgi:hypothetical protein
MEVLEAAEAVEGISSESPAASVTELASPWAASATRTIPHPEAPATGLRSTPKPSPLGDVPTPGGPGHGRDYPSLAASATGVGLTHPVPQGTLPLVEVFTLLYRPKGGRPKRDQSPMAPVHDGGYSEVPGRVYSSFLYSWLRNPWTIQPVRRG